MPEIFEADEFNPKKIADALFERCAKAKIWTIKCYVKEEWVIRGVVPFEIRMEDGIYTCKVIAPTKKEAFVMVADFMPVIQFIDNDFE